MPIRAGNLPTSTIDNTDYLLITEGEAPRKVAYSDVKADMVGSETLTTTSQTVKGAINENAASLSDIKQNYYSFKDATTIASSTDLNTLTTFGNYVCISAGVGTTLINSPVASAFVMKVERIVGDTNGANYNKQTIRAATSTGTKTYERCNYNGTYTTWQQIADGTDSGWITLPLGTATASTTTPVYRKIGNRVFLKNSFTNIVANNDIVGTLPTGFRPPESKNFIISLNGSFVCRVAVSSSGVIQIISLSTTHSSSYIYFLDAISFLID